MQVRNQNLQDFYNDEISARLMNIKDPEVLRQQRAAYQRKKYDELLQKISFLDTHLNQNERRYDYPEDFKPFVFFFKFLARRPDTNTSSNLNRLRLWLPDTIITGDGDNPPMWLYTSMDGYVQRTDNFTAKNITNKLGSFSSPDELVAVLKKPQARDFAYCGNDIRLLTMKDLSLISQSLVTNKGDMVCLQKYVKSIGPKAFICRTCWRRDRNPYVWVVTNTKDFFADDSNIPENQRYITNPRVMGSCTIVNSIRGRYVEETAPYIANIVRYIEHNIPGARFEEFVADFVKDESETWWLVNIRGFVLVDKMNGQPKQFLAGPDELDLPEKSKKKLKPEGYQKVMMCKYCEQQYPVEELLHKMTLRSIIQTDKHLMARGKTFTWLARSEIKHLDTAALYQEFKVCNTCYKLHEETEKLRDIEFEFAKVLGIPVNPERKPDNASAMNFNGSDFSIANLEALTNSLSSQAMVANRNQNNENDPTPQKAMLQRMKSDATAMSSARYDDGRYIKRYRMMLYLHMLYDVPKDIDTSKNYSIEYSILGQKQKYKVDLGNAFSINGDILIPINKLRVFYFFSPDRKGVNDFINEQRVLSLNLYCDTEKMGTVNFELNDFLSDKVIKREMFKVFAGKKLPILSWGLKVTVGLTEGGMEDVTRIKLQEHKNIYLSNPDFYTCDALPEEWLQVFEETHKHLGNLLNRTETRRNSRYLNTSLNGSFRKSNFRGSILRTSVLKPIPLSTEKSKIDSPDEVLLMDPTNNSPNKSLFENDKSISEEKSEKSHDDSLEVVRKILAESIKDYEKGDRRLLQKPLAPITPKENNSSVHKKKKKGPGVKSAATPARSWSAAIRPGVKQNSDK